ncbi:MAG: glycoside hydrolase family 2 protein [Catenulispora sp.]|nr:glycoside hydrolase family 2 protein [Catenulispora sp.]
MPSDWTVRAVGGAAPEHLIGVAVPATVPGSVHLDLLAAGVIPDPYLDENEAALAWIGRTDWHYETTLEWDGADTGGGTDGRGVDLVALGLDTVAVVRLNGTVVGESANMHRSHRFPVTGRLRPGANTLSVTFTGALTAAEQAAAEQGERPHVNRHPYNAVRKMACDYGWDWGPEIMTAGIWRPLYLETWQQAGIEGVRPLVEFDGDTGVVYAHVDLRWAAGTAGATDPLLLEVSVGDYVTTAQVTTAQVTTAQVATAQIPPGQAAAVAEVRVPQARRWWPRGYGDQPLYDIAVSLRDGDSVLDEWRSRIGFRTVAVDTTPDEHGTPFTLLVNDRPVFARGFNWIPGDCFPSRVTRELYAERLGQACEANANLIRVWGGGIYESEDFYELCDELGLLVWQDFLFACAAYPEEEPLLGEVIAEAREAIARLSAHPSLAVWNGGNEDVWGYHDWGWPPDLAGRSWGWRYYTEILPALLAELDPTRPYVPNSPYSFNPDLHPNDTAHGIKHIWDVWNELDYTEYRRHRPRFVAEFGFQGPPAWATLVRSVHDEPSRPDSPGMLAHQKADDGVGKLARGLTAHLPAPRTFDDWHWATSLNQARAVAAGVEHLRSLMPYCMGAVVWQLNDVWPVVSWSAVDGDGRRKPLWHALRRAFADRLLTIQPRDGGLALVTVNDSDGAWQSTVTVTRRSFEGTELARIDVDFAVPARGVATRVLPEEIVTPDMPESEVIIADTPGERALWQFEEDVAARLPEPKVACDVERTPTGYRVSVTAEAYVRDLAVLADKVAPDSEADPALVTLLPGESAAFDIRTTATVDPKAFLSPSVLRSANQLEGSPR